MKQLLTGCAGCTLLLLLLSGCGLELAQTQLGAEEEQWQTQIRASYSSWQPPRSAPPATYDNRSTDYKPAAAQPAADAELTVEKTDSTGTAAPEAAPDTVGIPGETQPAADKAEAKDAQVETKPEAAPEKAEVELEQALVGEYEKVTAEDMDNGVTFQIGANGDADQRVKLQIGDMGAKALGIADVDLTTSDGANKAIDVIDAAIQNVSAQRAQLGAMQNRLEHTINNLDTNNENLSAAESRIRDVDMAAEMMAYTKNNVLVQAAQSMLAQANQQPQSVLQLLQ